MQGAILVIADVAISCLFAIWLLFWLNDTLHMDWIGEIMQWILPFTLTKWGRDKNGHLAVDIFKRIFLYENIFILMVTSLHWDLSLLLTYNKLVLTAV